MRRPLYCLLAVWLIGVVPTVVSAQGHRTDFADYGNSTLGLTATPGTQGGSQAGFWNPAAWGAMQEWEASLLWNDHNYNHKRMDNWSLALGTQGIGFVMRRNDFLRDTSLTPNHERETGRVDDYSIGVGGGSPGQFWGLSYGWSRGRTKELKRDNELSVGSIYRPWRYLSIGNSGAVGLRDWDYRLISDIGVRPPLPFRVTVLADAAYGRYDSPTTMQWGCGLEIEPVDGIRIAGKLSKPYGDSQEKVFSVSCGLVLDGIGFHVIPHYGKTPGSTEDTKRLSTSYLIRAGEQAPSLDTRRWFGKEKKVVSVPMKGRLTYQKARWLDSGKIPLLETLDMIEEAKNDPTVGGIAFNLSGMDASREMLWEIREKLKEFKGAGKKVYIYFDRAHMYDYYFASIADYLWMDPMGNLYLPGFVAGRTYWKGFLEKIGIGVDEWRLFAYKSAFEYLSRKNMSDKDREQRLAMISDFVADWRREIGEAREMSPDTLWARVDTTAFFTPQMALAAGLVDTTGRWDDAENFIKKTTGKKPEFIPRDEVEMAIFPDPTWGELPKVAVVYAIGDCDMETGIHGRSTSKLLGSLAKRKDVKAVVLRADSPGGDPLPSDLVAQKMDEISKNKPMIVSQGNVAGSGGYWISMNSDRIFTSPLTATGSIGAVGGWMWNEKVSEKTGFTSDHVQVGRHADLVFGITLPIIGATIPDRNLSAEERSMMEQRIWELYRDFTGRVAASRGLDTAYVDSVGQGRVWTGTRAVQLKLADEIGGLDKAISYARKQANLPERGRGVKIVEYPKRAWLPFGDMSRSAVSLALLIRLFGGPEVDLATSQSETDDYELKVLKRMAARPGQALFMVPPEDMPAE
jgi:protease-4